MSIVSKTCKRALKLISTINVYMKMVYLSLLVYLSVNLEDLENLNLAIGLLSLQF